jgi:spore coat assembly protein SafA
MSNHQKENNAGVGGPENILPTVLPCPNGQLYTVKSGDTLFFIAKRFNIALQSLINANPQIVDPNTIFPGQVICVPSSVPGVSCPNGQTYRVVRGDTMFEIAKRFGVTLDALIRVNPQIQDPSLIFPGQEICIPTTSGPVPCPGGTIYMVKSGDTMFEIARRNNITLSALIAANPQIHDPNLIFPGQVICIPGAMGPEIPITPPPPVILPEPMPPMPMPMPPMPMPMPMPPTQPMPPVMPCPAGPGSMPMMYPMPVYVVIPWDECPYRSKKMKKHERHGKHCH